MSTTSMAIFSNPLFATYSVYAHNASIDKLISGTARLVKRAIDQMCATAIIFDNGTANCVGKVWCEGHRLLIMKVEYVAQCFLVG